MGMKLTAAQTGSQAVLLVQRQLLRCGVDSAPMTTDYGIDLVAYRREKGSCFTIQVKCRNHKKDGKHSWRIERKGRENPSDVFALLDEDDVWLSIAKMPSGWNAFEISDIRDIQLSRSNRRSGCNNVALG
jgi:Restriction endonuclease